MGRFLVEVPSAQGIWIKWETVLDDAVRRYEASAGFEPASNAHDTLVMRSPSVPDRTVNQGELAVTCGQAETAAHLRRSRS